MMPHPQHNLIEAKQMVVDFLSQHKRSISQTGTRARSGHASLINTVKMRLQLIYGSGYLDRGVLPVAPLRGTQMIRLRSKTVHGSSADDQKGVKLSKLGVSQIGHGDFICFKNIDLDEVKKVTAKVASGGSGGEIHLRLGSAHGEIIGKAIVQPNGSWRDYIHQDFELKKCEGRHDLYVCFHKPGISNGLMNLASLRFQ